jgi:AraC family transcriptional regulator of adaptative response/methylated-DNA-[protein]-cysteine methyltransferase
MKDFDDTNGNTARALRPAEDYRLVEEAVLFIERSFRKQPTLGQIAAHIGLSEFHFQRLFGRWAGISPKRFLQFLTKEYAKKLLKDSENLLNTAYEAGLSGPSRLHELMVTCEAVTPGEFKLLGKGLTISYGFHPSPFGVCMLAVTDRGICGLSFLQEGRGKKDLITRLASRWPCAEVVHDPRKTAPLIKSVFPRGFSGTEDSGFEDSKPLHLYVRGTNFQIQVWQALLRIPLGGAVSYETVAGRLGMGKAARAVGNAVGDNPIPFLIPCHRVLRKTGEFGNYGEGPARKKAILVWEASRKGEAGEF